MILVIDNYDSFTYNLVQYLGELGETVEVRRNDEIDLAGIEALAPDHILISPGPCTPNEAGISLAVIDHFKGSIPIFGVCLGHQSIGQAFGGNVIRAERMMHGKTSEMHHNGTSVFAGLPSPFTATRYHSLIVERSSLPDCLEVTAETSLKVKLWVCATKNMRLKVFNSTRNPLLQTMVIRCFVTFCPNK